MKKKILVVLGFLAVIGLLAPKYLTQNNSVIVNAPIDAVWKYVSDSSRAEYWSIYFDHITPMDDKDGQVGSVRRCYRYANETGPTWDEMVLEIKPPNFRKMKTFNLKGFSFKGHEKIEFYVFQEVEKLSDSQTRLTFASTSANLFEVISDPSLLQFVLSRFKPEAERIIKANLENIKYAIENGESTPPPHAFDGEFKFQTQ